MRSLLRVRLLALVCSCVPAVAFLVPAARCVAADFEFYGRSGDLIELDFGSLPGVQAGASFSFPSAGLGHSQVRSDQVNLGAFATTGRMWVAPGAGAPGDTDPDALGFQGRISGQVIIDGQIRSFGVTVQPGHTGVGQGAVTFDSGGNDDGDFNSLSVARQQHRLSYLGYVREGGGGVFIDGDFGSNTESAMRTFQAAIVGGNNTTQAGVDGVVGPFTTGWLNAANAPAWVELIDPDPQAPGAFSVGTMLGDFDLLPTRNPANGNRRDGVIPQFERWATSWAVELFEAGSALGKAETGRSQLMNGMSTDDGYGSVCCHNTHRAGMDIDTHIDDAAFSFGNGSINAEERIAIDHALKMIEAGLVANPSRGSVQRIIASNADIRGAINAVYPGLVIGDSSGGHRNHLHYDVGAPAQVTGLARLAGDLNADGVVDAADYTVYRDGLGVMHTAAVYTDFTADYGASSGGLPALATPEPTALAGMAGLALMSLARRRPVTG